MASSLVIFDIDGTLTRTNQADEICFASSVKEYFGIGDVVTDWASYTHSTDSGIIDELVGRRRGTKPSTAELEEFRLLFVKHLEAHRKNFQNSFDPVAGASAVFSQLRGARPNLSIGIATGAWKQSAHFKLSAAGIAHEDLPKAYADDHFSRDDILLTAIERSRKHYGKSNFQHITYVGDGDWDCVSAQRIGIDFIGLTDDRDPSRLKNAGAKKLIKDYSNLEVFMNLLEEKK